MATKRDELLSRLQGLLPARFEEVLFHLRIPSAQLSGVSAPQAMRAIEVLRHLENTGELTRLEPLLSTYDGTAAASLASAQTGPVSSPVHGGPFSPGKRVRSVPYQAKRERVIGRARVLEQVRQHLTAGRPTAIGHTASFQGIGGLGKTQLAVEYADRYGETYTGGIIWLDADRDIDAQLVKICDEAQWIDPRSEHQLKLDVALHRLRTYPDCLIVFDNVNDPAAIERFFPVPAAAAHFLVTSRAEQPGFEPIALDVLDAVQSLELLVQESGRAPGNDDERAAAQAIAARLAGLPLALEIAGAYIRHRAHVSWRDYQRLLDESIKQALAGSFLQSLTKHDKDLYATLRVSEAMLGDEPRLRDVLDILTVSGSASMSTSLLAELLDISGTALIGPLSLAVKLRLLGADNDPISDGSQRYRIHRLVQEVRRDEIAVEQRKTWTHDVSRRLAAWFEHRRVDSADLPALEAEIDHLRAWQQHALDGRWPVRARLAWLQAYPHYHRGRYREAHEWLATAESYHREIPAGDDLDALLADDMGQLEHKLGNPHGALGYFQRALELRRQRHGDDHADTALSLRNVARAYREIGSYKQALELSEQALATLHVVYGPRHRLISSVLNDVGVTHADLGDYQKALNFQSRALQLSQELLGAFHPDIATLLSNRGGTYGELGDDQTALALQRQALEIMQKAFGDEHPETATVRNGLGLTYLRLGKLQLAKEHTEGALKIRSHMFGIDHPDTAAVLINVAGVYSKLGDHVKALELKEQALHVYIRVFGETHPKTATALSNLGVAYQDLGEHNTALAYAQRSLDIRSNALGDHPDTADSFANVSAVEAALGHRKRALEHAKRALEILTKVRSPGHSRTLDIMLMVVNNWLRFDRPGIAYRLLDSWLEKLPLDHPRRAALTTRLHELPVPPGRRKAPTTIKRSKKRS
jgi:tetratricopeptide (TPR) repeat protein